MSQGYEQDQNQSTAEYLSECQEWLVDAIELVTGSREGNPLTVFPSPTEPRAAAEDPGFSVAQEASIREIAGRFGVGGEVDVPSAADTELVEGGKPWKVEAEAAIAGNGRLIYAGSPDRKIGADEADYMQQKTSVVAETEYDMVKQLASLQPGFEPLAQALVLPFGYDLTPDHELVQEQTGQLVQIGTQNGQPVYVLRVDRENYVNEDGKAKFRNRPDSAELMKFVADMLSASGDETSSVGMLTSNTYASLAIDAVRAGLTSNRQFSVGMYGRQTLADVQGAPVAELTAINQIPGELHHIATRLELLQNELTGNEQN